MNTLPLQITQCLLLQYTDDTLLICGGLKPTIASAMMNSQLMLHNSTVDCCQQNETKSTVMWFKVSNRKQSFELPDMHMVVDDTALQVVWCYLR